MIFFLLVVLETLSTLRRGGGVRGVDEKDDAFFFFLSVFVRPYLSYAVGL